jgi:hypothetical protein
MHRHSGRRQASAGADYTVLSPRNTGVPQVRGSGVAARIKPDTTQTEQEATNDHGPSVLIALGAILLVAVIASVAGVTKVIGLILIAAGALDLLTALTTGARREPI